MSATKLNPQIDESWKEILKEEFEKEYFVRLKDFLTDEKKQYKIYPPGSQIFAAFNRTPFDRVKVVIVGQDPYHGDGQANGMCFSVSTGIKSPPSLQNIFKELQADLGLPIPPHGNLEKWADHGVFLLNAILTVRANTPASHRNLGWEQFTDTVIQRLSEQKHNLVYILWGNYARSKKALIDSSKHCILESAHPSPFSVQQFFGCRHFSKTNNYLRENGLEEIDWSL